MGYNGVYGYGYTNYDRTESGYGYDYPAEWYTLGYGYGYENEDLYLSCVFIIGPGDTDEEGTYEYSIVVNEEDLPDAPHGNFELNSEDTGGTGGSTGGGGAPLHQNTEEEIIEETKRNIFNNTEEIFVPVTDKNIEKLDGTVECVQEGNTVNCIAKDENGNLLKNEEVIVIGPDGTVYTYTTNEDGTFSFLASEPGRWVYTFTNYNVSGSLMVNESNILITPVPPEEDNISGLLLIGGVIIVLGVLVWWLNTQGALGHIKGKKG